MCGVHLVDAEWPVVSHDIAPTSLLAHSVRHEEGLVGFLCAKPDQRRNYKK